MFRPKVLLPLCATVLVIVPVLAPAPAHAAVLHGTASFTGVIDVAPGLCYPLLLCSPNTATFALTSTFRCTGTFVEAGSPPSGGVCETILMNGTLSSNLLVGPYCGWHFADGTFSYNLTSGALSTGGGLLGVRFTWRVFFGSGAITVASGPDTGTGYIELTPDPLSPGSSCLNGAGRFLVEGHFDVTRND